MQTRIYTLERDARGYSILFNGYALYRGLTEDSAQTLLIIFRG